MLDFLIGNDLLSALLAFAIVLIPAVIAHELGHFFAARAVGITVLEFGIGFPPRIAKLFTWKETEFTLNALPLGGFVRPLGEDYIRPVGEEATEREREKLAQRQAEGRAAEGYMSEREELAARGVVNATAVSEVKPLPRIFFMAAGAIANFILAFVVFILVGLLGIPELVGVRVGFADIPANTPLSALGLQTEDYIESVDGVYYASQADLFAALAEREGETVTLQIRRAASTPDEIFTLDVVPDEALLQQINTVQPYVLINAISEASPAEEAGLEPGDYITAFNGQALDNAFDPAQSLVELTNGAAGEEVTLTIWRDGETFEVTTVPRLDPPPGDGRIGIGIDGQFIDLETNLIYVQRDQTVLVPQSLGDSVAYSAETFGSIMEQIVAFPARLVQGSTAPEERRVVSIVGISQLGGRILQESIEEEQPSQLLNFVALISIALGFTNLLPIPALDGGRIMFALLELVRGKPIPPEREGLVHLVGVMLILSLSILVIINDLMNPITNLIP
ncbi:MAG: RIP metalloprotease RseP [Anaerolineae bacterium]